ncbi:MAG: hypothetical protein ACRDGJ_10745, partial [Candidatus Limnocylindria bacterium]
MRHDRPGGRSSGSPIGRGERRVGGFERVTGAQRYVADIRLEGALHVKLVHLDCARARIVSIDAEPLRACFAAGAIAVIAGFQGV